jgi:RNA polymerase sigma-54 factor
MAMDAKLSLRQSQKLVMTTMLQQAIKLLPLSKLELVQLINNELLENPLLEENALLDEETASASEEISENKKEEVNDLDFNWDDYFQNRNVQTTSPFNDIDLPSLENTMAHEVSLTDYLSWQLALSSYDKLERCIGMFLIGNIDNDGYLKCDLEEAAKHCNIESGFVEKVLRLIQNFDPPGIASRNLRECLLIQLHQQGMEDSLPAGIVEKHLEKLEERYFQKIAKEENVSLEDVIKAVRFIRELNPKPGLKYNPKTIEYIIPDVMVIKVDDDYQIVINNEGIPRLGINSFYQSIMKNKENIQGSDKQYIEEKFKSALWLIKSIEQRRQTLYKVSRSIVKFQREFFDKGTAYLKPLVLRDVADDISMHESTISRITTNKYMHTPQGIFELKYFFHSGIDSMDGDAMSSLTVKEKIRKVVESEDDKKPYTDQEIVELLRKEDIIIARRTITKYRKEMKIPPSSKRKRIFNL